VTALTVRALGRGGKTAVEDRAQISASWAGGVGAAVFVFGMVKGAEGANGVRSSAPLLDVAKLPTVSTLRAWVGGIRLLDLAGTAEEV
jgi:hypothetical protein